MLVWYVVCENGFIGTREYETEDMAKKAAQDRVNLTGKKWYVKCYKTYMRGV